MITKNPEEIAEFIRNASIDDLRNIKGQVIQAIEYLTKTKETSTKNALEKIKEKYEKKIFMRKVSGVALNIIFIESVNQHNLNDGSMNISGRQWFVTKHAADNGYDSVDIRSRELYRVSMNMEDFYELAAEDELNLCIKEAQKFVNDSLYKFKCEVTDKLKETYNA